MMSIMNSNPTGETQCLEHNFFSGVQRNLEAFFSRIFFFFGAQIHSAESLHRFTQNIQIMGTGNSTRQLNDSVAFKFF